MKFLKIKINKQDKVEMEYYTDTTDKNPEPARLCFNQELNAIAIIKSYYLSQDVYIYFN